MSQEKRSTGPNRITRVETRRPDTPTQSPGEGGLQSPVLCIPLAPKDTPLSLTPLFLSL